MPVLAQTCWTRGKSKAGAYLRHAASTAASASGPSAGGEGANASVISAASTARAMALRSRAARCAARTPRGAPRAWGRVDRVRVWAAALPAACEAGAGQVELSPVARRVPGSLLSPALLACLPAMRGSTCACLAMSWLHRLGVFVQVGCGPLRALRALPDAGACEDTAVVGRSGGACAGGQQSPAQEGATEIAMPRSLHGREKGAGLPSQFSNSGMRA